MYYTIQFIYYQFFLYNDSCILIYCIELGCDRVVLVLTKPEDTPRTSGKDEWFAARIRKKYPLAAEGLCRRAQRYNEGVARAREYAKQGRALIIAPDDTCGVDTLRRDKEALQRLYTKGYQDAEKIKAFIQN